MDLKQFIKEDKWIDIEKLGLDTLLFKQDCSKKCMKFLQTMKEIEQKKIAFIRPRGRGLSFYTKELKSVPMNLTSDYKRTLISANVFLKDKDGYILNPVYKDYIVILSTNNPTKRYTMKIGKQPYVISGMSHMKNSYVEHRIKTSLYKKVIEVKPEIFGAYHVYKTQNKYTNTFSAETEDHTLALGLRKDGLYLMYTMKKI